MGQEKLRYMTNLTKFIQIVSTRGLLKAFIKKPTVASLSSFQITEGLSKYQPSFKTILDVGANIGQFAYAASCRFPEASIYSFEPAPDVFNQLQKNFIRNRRFKCFNLALGNHNGKVAFHQNEFCQISSCLKIDENNDNPYYAEKKTSVIEVDAARLDDFSSHIAIEEPVLLKMDVQGLEKEVLLGAEKFLNSVEFVLFEVSLVSLYENQPLFDEMHTFMKEIGYGFVAPLGFNEGLHERVIELDVLYERV